MPYFLRQFFAGFRGFQLPKKIGHKRRSRYTIIHPCDAVSFFSSGKNKYNFRLPGFRCLGGKTCEQGFAGLVDYHTSFTELPNMILVCFPVFFGENARRFEGLQKAFNSNITKKSGRGEKPSGDSWGSSHPHSPSGL